MYVLCGNNMSLVILVIFKYRGFRKNFIFTFVINNTIPIDMVTINLGNYIWGISFIHKKKLYWLIFAVSFCFCVTFLLLLCFGPKITLHKGEMEPVTLIIYLKSIIIAKIMQKLLWLIAPIAFDILSTEKSKPFYMVIFA